MRRKLFITGLILFLILVGGILLMVWQNYNQSKEYNFITAKLDIKDGNCRLVTIGSHKYSPKEKEMDSVSAKYGFKNVYLQTATPDETKGIETYNETIEVFLAIRNGPGWRNRYQKEVDSLSRSGKSTGMEDQ